MDGSVAHLDWARFQTRWMTYAQEVKAQWPEISIADILATRGSRHRLCRCVARTYGLDPDEAERAVSIWQHAQRPPRDEPRARTSAA